MTIGMTRPDMLEHESTCSLAFALQVVVLSGAPCRSDSCKLVEATPQEEHTHQAAIWVRGHLLSPSICQPPPPTECASFFFHCNGALRLDAI